MTPIGPLGVVHYSGDLAFDGSTGTMFMTDGAGGMSGQTSSLYTVDLTTGAATLVGPMNSPAICALAYDPNTNKLYGCGVSGGWPMRFVEVSRSTGHAMYIGNPSYDIWGLTHRGTTGEILGLAGGTGWVSLDTTTGASTLLAGGNFYGGFGIAWAPSSDRVYAMHWTGLFYEYDPNNSWSSVQLYSGLGEFDGLALAGPSCPQPTAYCTAGTSTNGCNASIDATGTPQVGQSSGFSIHASNVEGQKTGILFYGIDNTGFTPPPWAVGSSSFLCVKAPMQRMTTQFTGGTFGQCDGALSIDWLAYMAATPGALGQPLSAGQTFQGQAWFRDPPAPKTTNLSDALTWVVCP